MVSSKGENKTPENYQIELSYSDHIVKLYSYRKKNIAILDFSDMQPYHKT